MRVELEDQIGSSQCAVATRAGGARRTENATSAKPQSWVNRYRDRPGQGRTATRGVVTPGDIRLANGNPDAMFTAIHPDFFSDDTPYLLTGVEFPDRN
jgi:hypothetical protein